MKKLYILLFTVFSFNINYSQNSTQTIIDDMASLPDAALHGVPSYYSWASGAANGQNPVPAKNNQGEWFRAMTSWGQVYIPVEGSQASNTRCQIRNMLSKLLYKNGKWIEVQSDNPQGAAFIEDFANNASINAGIRDESNNGGGISVIVGVGPWAGYNFHFWPLGSRAEVDVDSVIGVFSTCEARLILHDQNQTDDRDSCKNIMQMGADWWLNLNIGWLPDWSANNGIGNGRSKWVTKEWQSFNYYSLSPAEILSNPPIFATSNIEVINTHEQLNIFPNPSQNKITINLLETVKLQNLYILIYDLQGYLLFQQQIMQKKLDLSLACLAKGVYLVKIRNDLTIIIRKVVKE
ncbi:MAG: T9SS type A sorting domain-containing protein [Bacteroidota bacterium]